MARISLQNVTKIFDGEITAVSHFTIEVADGEFMVVVGPSGCGKTTILRMIAGLEQATTGEIYIGDTPVGDLTAKDRDIAMVFQNYALYPHMTVYQNMAFALRMRKVSRAETRRRIENAAQWLGIGHLLNRKPKALSGGQRQRAALGRAIVRKPKAFLFDEPLSNLDAGLRLAMRTELKNLRRKLTTTTVYVTHDQGEAMSLGDRICVMCDGAIQQIADPVQVYERPANRFVAGFFGTPPMNFFTGHIRCRDDESCFEIRDETVVLPQRLRDLAGQYEGREMILGVRPEDVRLDECAGSGGRSISATVDVVEPMGARTDVHMTGRAGQKFVAAIPPQVTLAAGDVVRVCLNSDRVHIFEPGRVGRNVCLPGEAV